MSVVASHAHPEMENRRRSGQHSGVMSLAATLPAAITARHSALAMFSLISSGRDRMAGRDLRQGPSRRRRAWEEQEK